MLYDGANELFSGNVRVDASPATSAGSSCRGCQITTAWPSTSMPRRPARPVSCVYSPGVSGACCSPLNFTSRSSTTVRAGMLMPSASVSVANTALTRPAVNSSSTVCRKIGSMPGVVGGQPPQQALTPLVVAEHGQIGVGQVAAAPVDHLGDPRRGPRRWSAAATSADTA